MSRATVFFCSLLILGLMASGSVIAAESDADKALADVRAKIDAMFDEIGPEDVNASPVDGWYTVHKGSIIAYVSEDGRYLLQGDMIDLVNQVNLSEQARTVGRLKVMAPVGDDQAILFSPADTKYSVTVFTDVECTYCRKLHSQIDEYLAQGIEIRYLLYPRNGPASNSWTTSEQVWCADNRNAALTAAKLDRKFETNKCDASVISRNYMLGRDVGLTGTPAIVFEDGTLLSGYLPPAELASRLQSIRQSAAND
jgi:thiol:disulfide interchange protein DsbC